MDDVIATYRGEPTVFKLNPNSEESYVEFTVGEHPHMPRSCYRFFCFSSKITGSLRAELYLQDIYRIATNDFGDRVHYWNQLNKWGSHVDGSGCYNWGEVHTGEHRTGQPKPARTIEALSEKAVPTASELAAMKLFEVKEVPGKGLGVIASKDIPEGARILIETTLFTLPGSLGTCSLAAVEEMFLEKVKRLSPDQQRAFLSLRNSHHQEFGPLLGIVQTNMLPIEPAAGDDGNRGVFRLASRFNHSCHPNSQYTWNHNLEALTVHALCNIEAGTEIAISYMSGLSITWAERQRYLQANFFFTYSYHLYSSPAPTRALSDQRLTKISTIENELGGDDAMSPSRIYDNYAALFSKVHRLLSLLDEEGLRGLSVTKALDAAFRIAVILGDKARAQVFAERVYAEQKLMSGCDHPYAVEYKQVAQRPIDHLMYDLELRFCGDYWEAPRDLERGGIGRVAVEIGRLSVIFCLLGDDGREDS